MIVLVLGLLLVGTGAVAVAAARARRGRLGELAAQADDPCSPLGTVRSRLGLLEVVVEDATVHAGALGLRLRSLTRKSSERRLAGQATPAVLEVVRDWTATRVPLLLVGDEHGTLALHGPSGTVSGLRLSEAA